MPNANRKSTTYNQIIGILKTGEIMVLEETFDYQDGFKGATGYTMDTITQSYIDEMQESTELLEDYWRQAVANGETTDSLEDWAEQMQEGCVGYYFGDDTSFRDDMDRAVAKLAPSDLERLVKEVGEKGKDFVDWSVGGCGRCVATDPDEYLVIFDPDLFAVAVEAEKK